jgi:hypothetical protein
MVTATCTQTVAWLGLRLGVPGDWQVVRHGLSPSRGSLTLIDRYRQRMELGWRQCNNEPDLDHMIGDDRARQLQQHPDAHIEDLEPVADWRGTTRLFDDSGHAVTRAVRFDAATSRLLEAVIVTAEGPEDLALVPELLEGVEVEAPATRATHWRAFDVEVRTPGPSWRLVSTQVKPADVTLRYAVYVPAEEAPRKRPPVQRSVAGALLLPPAPSERSTGEEATIRRMGMASTWWDGNGASFLRRHGGGVPLAIRETPHDGRFITVADAVEPGPRLKRMLGRLRRRQQAVWHCKACNAVYHVDVLSWASDPVGFDALVTRCGASPGGCHG